MTIMGDLEDGNNAACIEVRTTVNIGSNLRLDK